MAGAHKAMSTLRHHSNPWRFNTANEREPPGLPTPGAPCRKTGPREMQKQEIPHDTPSEATISSVKQPQGVSPECTVSSSSLKLSSSQGSFRHCRGKLSLAARCSLELSSSRLWKQIPTRENRASPHHYKSSLPGQLSINILSLKASFDIPQTEKYIWKSRTARWSERVNFSFSTYGFFFSKIF